MRITVSYFCDWPSGQAGAGGTYDAPYTFVGSANLTTGTIDQILDWLCGGFGNGGDSPESGTEGIWHGLRQAGTVVGIGDAGGCAMPVLPDQTDYTVNGRSLHRDWFTGFADTGRYGPPSADYYTAYRSAPTGARTLQEVMGLLATRRFLGVTRTNSVDEAYSMPYSPSAWGTWDRSAYLRAFGWWSRGRKRNGAIGYYGTSDLLDDPEGIGQDIGAGSGGHVAFCIDSSGSMGDWMSYYYDRWKRVLEGLGVGGGVPWLRQHQRPAASRQHQVQPTSRQYQIIR